MARVHRLYAATRKRGPIVEAARSAQWEPEALRSSGEALVYLLFWTLPRSDGL